MKLLDDRVLKDGRCLGRDILKVDSFLNHQIDVALVDAMGQEFARLFEGLGVNKILTIETSGIPIAYAAARAMGDLPSWLTGRPLQALPRSAVRQARSASGLEPS